MYCPKCHTNYEDPNVRFCLNGCGPLSEKMSLTCPSCGFENREGVKFCEECAVPLGEKMSLACPSCGFENREGVKFCEKCAEPLGGAIYKLAPEPETAWGSKLDSALMIALIMAGSTP